MPQLSGKIVMAPAARLRQEGHIGLGGELASQITQCCDVKAERTRTGQIPKIDKLALEHPRHAGVIMNRNRVGHTGKMPVATPLIYPRCSLEAAAARSIVEVRA